MINLLEACKTAAPQNKAYIRLGDFGKPISLLTKFIWRKISTSVLDFHHSPYEPISKIFCSIYDNSVGTSEHV